MPRSTERWRPLLTKVGDLRLRLGQHFSLRKLDHWPQICIKRQRCRQLDKSSLRLATEINNKGHPDRCFSHLHLFIRLCHTITFGSASHEQKLHCRTTQKHSVYWINESSGWRCGTHVFQISFDLRTRTAQDSRLPYLDWGGGDTKSSSPLCKVTSVNYSDTQSNWKSQLALFWV